MLKKDFHSRNLDETSEKVKLEKLCWSVKLYGVLKNLLFVRELSSRSRSTGDFPHESGSGIPIPEPT
jgi:hypothetical protein